MLSWKEARATERFLSSIDETLQTYDRLLADYLRSHREEIAKQLATEGSAIIPALKAGGWIPPTMPIEVRLDKNNEMTFGKPPVKYVSIAEFHFG